MLCINNTFTDIYFNLAAEEHLLKNHSEDIFMLWQSDKVVVLGKHQNIAAEIDTDFVKNKNISIARRYSGGGTVYQDLGNINLTFISNTNRLDFKQYTQNTIDFLNSVGIHAQPDNRLGINIGQFKISGSAQCVYKNRIMYHCTLLYSSDLETLTASLKGKPEAANVPGSRYTYHVKSVKSEVTNIERHLPDPPGIDRFKKLILRFFTENTNGFLVYKLNQDDILAIKQLRNNKYAVNAWIQGKTS